MIAKPISGAHGALGSGPTRSNFQMRQWSGHSVQNGPIPSDCPTLPAGAYPEAEQGLTELRVEPAPAGAVVMDDAARSSDAPDIVGGEGPELFYTTALVTRAF